MATEKHAILSGDANGETNLEIEVSGKRSVGYCKSTTGAVRPIDRMVERNQLEPTDRHFHVDHNKQFNRILGELGMKFDRQGDFSKMSMRTKLRRHPNAWSG